jgi:hypothetical protein
MVKPFAVRMVKPFAVRMVKPFAVRMVNLLLWPCYTDRSCATDWLMCNVCACACACATCVVRVQRHVHVQLTGSCATSCKRTNLDHVLHVLMQVRTRQSTPRTAPATQVASPGLPTGWCSTTPTSRT